jgi:hypothetical protein
VATPSLATAQKFGMSPPNPMRQEEVGARAVFMATSDSYAVQAGLIPLPERFGFAKKSSGEIFLGDPQRKSANNERMLVGLRE